MSIAQIIGAAIGFVIIAAVLWNMRGHARGGDGSDNQHGPGPGQSVDADTGGWVSADTGGGD